MKQFRNSLAAVAAVFALSTTIFYAACEKDSCTDLQCQNGGSCADNFCRCKTGFEGASCETRQADRFLGKWGGTTRCTNETPDNPIGPNINDSLTIFLKTQPNQVGLVLRQKPKDTVYGTVVGMEIQFNDIVNGNTRRSFSARLNGKNINYFSVFSRDVNRPETQTDCNFIGFRPM